MVLSKIPLRDVCALFSRHRSAAAKLAARIGVSRSHFSSYLSGRAKSQRIRTGIEEVLPAMLAEEGIIVDRVQIEEPVIISLNRNVVPVAVLGSADGMLEQRTIAGARLVPVAVAIRRDQ